MNFMELDIMRLLKATLVSIAIIIVIIAIIFLVAMVIYLTGHFVLVFLALMIIGLIWIIYNELSLTKNKKE